MLIIDELELPVLEPLNFVIPNWKCRQIAYIQKKKSNHNSVDLMSLKLCRNIISLYAINANFNDQRNWRFAHNTTATIMRLFHARFIDTKSIEMATQCCIKGVISHAENDGVGHPLDDKDSRFVLFRFNLLNLSVMFFLGVENHSLATTRGQECRTTEEMSWWSVVVVADAIGDCVSKWLYIQRPPQRTQVAVLTNLK